MYAFLLRVYRHLAGFFLRLHPAQQIVLGYASYILLGFLLLSLSDCQARPVSALDTFFMAASAFTTTGLITVDTGGDFTLVGQIVILFLIQIGGVGYMTFSSFVLLSTRRPLSPLRERVGLASYGLPGDFRIADFIRAVVIFTLLTEAAGAVVLFRLLRAAGDTSPLWSALFHSVSAFCTAGFSLNPDSFESFADHTGVNLTIAALSYAGGIGFIVWVDLWKNLTGARARMTFTSQIILKVSFWLTVAGTVLVYLCEPSFEGLPPERALLRSFFQAMSAMTTVGFNTVPIGGLSHAVLLALTVLMVFGASPSGTGGGLKSTTVTVLYALVRSAIGGQDSIRFRNREIPLYRIRQAVASAVFYVAMIVLALFFLLQLESAAPEHLVFEAASALGTTGLSTGITASLSPLGKCILVFLMFAGRTGVLTFGIALTARDESPAERKDNEIVL